MRAEGERDAALRELAEIRAALGDLVNAGGNKGLPETVASLAEYAMRTSDRLIEVSDERDLLRAKVSDAAAAIREFVGSLEPASMRSRERIAAIGFALERT